MFYLDYVIQPRISVCPTCRIPFNGQSYRLYFAERLLEERVPISCRFADNGCKVSIQILGFPYFQKTIILKCSHKMLITRNIHFSRLNCQEVQ